MMLRGNRARYDKIAKYKKVKIKVNVEGKGMVPGLGVNAPITSTRLDGMMLRNILSSGFKVFTDTVPPTELTLDNLHDYIHGKPGTEPLPPKDEDTGNGTPTEPGEDDNSLTPTKKPVTAVAFTNAPIEPVKEETYALAWEIAPKDADNKEVILVVDDESIATIDPDGTVRKVVDGTVIVTVTTVDGEHSDMAEITFEDEVTEETGSEDGINI